MKRNLRTEGFMKGIRVINSCVKTEHFNAAANYIKNYVSLCGDETFGGEYARLLTSQLRDRKQYVENA